MSAECTTDDMGLYTMFIVELTIELIVIRSEKYIYEFATEGLLHRQAMIPKGIRVFLLHIQKGEKE